MLLQYSVPPVKGATTGQLLVVPPEPVFPPLASPPDPASPPVACAPPVSLPPELMSPPLPGIPPTFAPPLGMAPPLLERDPPEALAPPVAALLPPELVLPPAGGVFAPPVLASSSSTLPVSEQLVELTTTRQAKMAPNDLGKTESIQRTWPELPRPTSRRAQVVGARVLLCIF